MKIQSCILFVLFLSMGLSLPGCGKSGESTGQSADGRCPHEIKQEKCPFCNPGLVESEGFCGAHAVAEALCAKCRPYLNAAFRAQGDWCDEHASPETQCMTCNPELAEKVRPGEHGVQIPSGSDADSANCPHGIVEARCPFCSPEIIAGDGFCEGHNVAEALCVQCRPFLKTAFIAKGDWCGEHNTPESQCTLCNPNLDRSSNEGGG